MLKQIELATKQDVPPWLQYALYLMLLSAGAVSVPLVGAMGPLPTTTLLDIWIIIFAVVCFTRGRTRLWGLFLLLVAYMLTRIVPALATGSPLYDFAQAYRWVLYLIVFTLAVGRTWGSMKSLIVTTWWLIGFAFVKAVATTVLLGFGERPGLLLENNFELALFSGLATVVYRHLSPRQRLWILLLLGGLTVLSGSRSGAVAFFLLVVYAVTQTKRVNLFLRYLLTFAIPAVGYVVYSVFASRFLASGRIDRLNFLNVFVHETAPFTPLTWLFGTTPITALSSSGCARLNYYEKLFSSVGDGTCYSVIFHAFNLRIIFDAGIIGLFLCFGITLYTLLKAGVRFGSTFTLLAIAFTNGLSVSGLNNPYVALPIMLAILTSGIPQGPASDSSPNAALAAWSPSRQLPRKHVHAS